MSDGSHADDTTPSAENTGAPGDGTATEKKPVFLKVIKGNPTAPQVAALTTLFAGMSANTSDDGEPETPNNWGRFDEKFMNKHTSNAGNFPNLRFY